jgi:hypothetical protein
LELALLLLIGSHVTAALAHTFIFRDRIMQRMLPGKPTVTRAENLRPGVVAKGLVREPAWTMERIDRKSAS